MPEAVIVAASRTPIGRANKGSLADVRPEDVRLGMAVEPVFRRIHEVGGRPNYYWKGVPKPEGEPA